jgi:tetratricopeptide (TPR) repeat protein
MEVLRLLWSIVLCSLFVMGSARTAWADIDSDSVKAGVAAYDELDYEGTITALESALTESLTREEQIVTYKTLAFAYAALDKAEEARASFVKLLRLDNSLVLDHTVAPRVRALFEEARTAFATGQVVGSERPSLPVVNATVHPATLKEGKPLSFEGTLTGGAAQKIRLFHRARGDLRYAQVDGQIKPSGQFVLTAPAGAIRAPAFEYYFTALDEHGAEVAQSGSYAQPLVLAVSAMKRPLYKRAWFWGTIAGVVVGGVVVGVLSATRVTESRSGDAQVTIVAPH